MRICRVAVDEEVSYGVVEGVGADGEITDETVIALLVGHPVGDLVPDGRVLPLADVRLLAPVIPSKVLAVGRNYAAHAQELGNDLPAEPMIFLKPSTSVIGPRESIMLPWQSESVEHEAELAVVIKRLCRDVPAHSADDVIWGYTCANDVTARDLQRRDGQWTRAKGFDTFCPIGPWIETDFRPADAAIRCTVNGDVRQQADLTQMVFDVPALVEAVSAVMTLVPGDVILTGTPAGVGPLREGDTVTVAIDGIGSLTNRVVERG
ncbi:MAG: fumarylacetoacetate hydrolase family protein [Actinomycetales bacterium]|nr:fumarylacetoacetate hydrolase family protein [Actinomycetales bacterium]